MKLLHALFLLLISLIPHRTYIVDAANAQMLVSGQNLPVAGLLPFVPTPQYHPALEIYELVPALRPVAACESTGNPEGTPREFNSDGSILWGQEKNASGTVVIVKRDCGEGQINTEAHGRDPGGLDVCGNEDDNVYEMYLLYEESGLSPWSASKNCWVSAVQSSSISVDGSGEK